MVYNILNCQGWGEAANWVASAPCLKARLGFVILFFIFAVLRKWGAEEWGLPFSFLFSLLLSLVPYFIVILFFGSFKIALVVGIIGGIIGGYGGGFLGGGEE